MRQVVQSWFPSPAFANLFGVVVLLVLLLDQVMPRLMGSTGSLWRQTQDRYSFVAIYLGSLVGLAIGLYLRWNNLGLVPVWVQAASLVLLVAATFLREWSIALLGPNFSRAVTIKPGQSLVTSGPYQVLRHPAYTGMILMDSAILLGIGTWVGAVVMLVILLIPTLYRIRVEEAVLARAFGEPYRAWAARTWRLFPGW